MSLGLSNIHLHLYLSCFNSDIGTFKFEFLDYNICIDINKI